MVKLIFAIHFFLHSYWIQANHMCKMICVKIYTSYIYIRIVMSDKEPWIVPNIKSNGF